eukprot:gene8684-6105_t
MSTKYTAPTSKPGTAPSAADTVPDEVKVKVCSGHTRPVCHINYSEIVDGTYWFVAACHDSKAVLRNGQTGAWVGTFEGHQGAIHCTAFNSGATRLVTGSGDYMSFLWDAVTGKKLHQWGPHAKYIKSCDWMDNKIATGCVDGVVRIFDANRVDADPVVFESPSDAAQIKATYFLDPNIMVTASENTLFKWDLRDASTPYIRKEIPHLNFVEYTHRNDIVVAHENNISLIDTTKLTVKSTFNTGETVACASISPDGKNIAAGSRLKVKEFTVDGTELENNRGHHGPIFHIRWAPDGSSYASGAEDGMVRIWPSHSVIEQYETDTKA